MRGAAVGRPPFFHIGSDETATLGLGATQAYVAQHGRSQVYADHIVAMNRLIAPSGARIMLWDDGIENDPGIMKLIPRTAVVVNWHYGDQPTFEPYIATIARGGFEQMVAPGASNWNEIFPNVDVALDNESRFIDEGKAAHVLGLFQTVWHDDGETLYEATWYPVLYAAAAAWQASDLTPQAFASDFPSAFFGVDDSSYSSDIDNLAAVLAEQTTQTMHGAELTLESIDERLRLLDATSRADPHVLHRMLEARIAELEQRIAQLVGSPADIASPPLPHSPAATPAD